MRFLMLLLLCSPVLRGQVNNVFSLKTSLGMNGCQIHGDNYSGYDKFGIFLGTAVNAKFSEKSSMEVGFYFSQKGSKHNSDPKNNDYTYYRAQLNYLDIPVSFYNNFYKKYYAMAGPSIAYLISYKEESHDGDLTGRNPFNKFEVGVNIGAGINLNEKWAFEVRCSNSVTPVRNYGTSATQIQYTNPVARVFNKGLYSNVLSVFFTYQLSLRKNG